MNSEGIFRGPDEELAQLNRELADIRVAMRDLSSRMAQIERHVKRAFRVPTVKQDNSGQPSQSSSQSSTMSADEAFALFRELTDVSHQMGNDAVENRLQKLSIPDLKLLAHELGISFPSKPGRLALHKGIRGRISESVMLSRNTNVSGATPESGESGSESKKEESGPPSDTTPS